MKTQKSNNKKQTIIRSTVFLFAAVLGLFLSAQNASAQPVILQPGRQVQPIRRPNNPVVNTCQPTSLYIRNVPYNDYSKYTHLASSSVAAGSYVQIVADRCLTFSRNLTVTLQDVTRGSGYGVTVFRLQNVYVSGNTVSGYIPNYPILKNRTYHVAVFDYGYSPFVTVNPGTITVQ